MDALLRLLMGPWTTYILWVLHSNGPTRFGELKRRVAGISAKMLTERLRMLEDSGVVHRNHQPTVPPQVTYSLTARGQELRQVLDGLAELARSWQLADAGPAEALSAPPAAQPATAPRAVQPQPVQPQPVQPRSNEARPHEERSRNAEDRPERVRRPLVPAAE